MKVSDWDHENLRALEGLQQGDVKPLIALLEDRERQIHVEVRRWLAAMLKGDGTAVWPWWLELKRRAGHPPRRPEIDPRKPKSDPVERLIELLDDTERPIPAEARRRLAALLSRSRGDDPITRSWQLRCTSDRRRWQQPSKNPLKLELQNIRIGLLIHKFWSKGIDINIVKTKVGKKLKRSPRTIDGAWSDYRDFCLRLQEAGSRFAPHLHLRPLRDRLLRGFQARP